MRNDKKPYMRKRFNTFILDKILVDRSILIEREGGEREGEREREKERDRERGRERETGSVRGYV